MECNGVEMEEVLSLKQISQVLNQAVGDRWQLLGSEVKPASLGLSGFLGDHFRATLHVKVGDSVRKVHIFVKRLPVCNKPKADFIDENNYYRREVLMYELFEKLPADDPEPWFAKAYICSDKLVVLPDLLHGGYRPRPARARLDLPHTLLAAAALARFHAAFANYETTRRGSGYVSYGQEHADLLKEPTFNDSPWLRAAAKLTTDFLRAFSDKWDRYPENLEEVLIKLYIEACDSLTESDSLNVVNHKDLWVNNIMFKYKGDTPISALLIDFQCIRYGPPAFDLMIFFYLNTSRRFRERYESTVLRQYFVTFVEHVDESTKERLRVLGYDYDSFLGWCNKARMFAMLEAIAIFPYVLMDPATAQKTFDDPETYMKYCYEDRSAPVLAHARQCAAYKDMQLDVSEEFVERYVLNRL